MKYKLVYITICYLFLVVQTKYHRKQNDGDADANDKHSDGNDEHNEVNDGHKDGNDKHNDGNDNAVNAENYVEVNAPEEDVDFEMIERIRGDDRSDDEKPGCWMTLGARKHFQVMDEIDERYAEVRKNYQRAVGNDNFDREMLDVMLKSRGVAQREIYKNGGDTDKIPAGLNLGGYCMMRMSNSLLFFHRMKLRNNTHFRVQYLSNDLANMTVTARFALNDLHLVGSYERSITDRDPSMLIYRPTFGQAELLLKDVRYKMEGRYRLLKDRLFIELVISDLLVNDVLLTYPNNGTAATTLKLESKNVEEFLARLKNDLDKWLKDYLNDYLMYFNLAGANQNAEFQKYDKEKSLALNDYADKAIEAIKEKLYSVRATSVMLPKFSVYGLRETQFIIKNGELRGLNSIYRRSMATGKKEGNIRKVDVIVGFSNLKVIYRYDAVVSTGLPPLDGELMLSADELTARLSLTLLNDPETVDIRVDFLQQIRPESLTVEGPANRMISNFKHLLEYHIIAIMSNTLTHTIRQLSTLTKCTPNLIGNDRIPRPSLTSEDHEQNDHKEIIEPPLEPGTDEPVNSDQHDEPKYEPEPEDEPEPNEPEHNESEPNEPDPKEVPENPTYIISKNDTLELELPNKDNPNDKQHVQVNYNEKLSLKKVE